MKVHGDHKPLICEICNTKFTKLNCFKEHIKVHSADYKPFSCEMCGVQFTMLSSLINHVKVHSGEKPFVCHQCKKSFAEKTDLEKHLRDHPIWKRLTCSECGLTFTSKRSLYKHQYYKHRKDHPSEKRLPCSEYERLPCSECELTFASKGTLNRHALRIHTSESDKKFTPKERSKESSTLFWNDQKEESSLADDPNDVFLDSMKIEGSEESIRHARSHPAVGPQSGDPSGSSSTIAGSFGRVNTRPWKTYGCGVCNRSFLTKEETIKCFNGHH